MWCQCVPQEMAPSTVIAGFLNTKSLNQHRIFGSPGWDRTSDQSINSRLLYR